MATLHISLDESGDFTFSPRGTRYFTFAATWTYDPLPLAQDITSLRISLLKSGMDISSFHASADKQSVRNSVMEVLNTHTNWYFAAIVVEKSKVYPHLYDPRRFYPEFAAKVMRFILRYRVTEDTETILFFTDTLPINKRREGVEKAIKSVCRSEIRRDIQFHSFHHERASNAWIQVADYCSWAIFRKWEHNDDRAYRQINGRMQASELSVLGRVARTYY